MPEAEPNVERVDNGKGNLYAKERMFGAPVLRDRTNLLMKKGTGDDPSSGKKPKKQTKDRATSDMRNTAKLVDTENRTAKNRSSPVARSNLGKEGAAAKRVSAKRAKDKVGEGPRRSLRRSIDLKENKGSTSPIRKFFKSKVIGAANNVENGSLKKKSVVGRRKIVHDKPKLSTSFRLRQTKLRESFAKTKPQKDLRKRNVLKNYCEDSTILEKTGVDQQAQSGDGVKRPIYKTAKLLDDRENNADGIYDFSYNINDSQEKIARKKKKRKVATNVVKNKAKASSSNTKRATGKRVIAKRPATKVNSEKIQDNNQVEYPVTFDLQDDVDSSQVAMTDQTLMKNPAGRPVKPIVVKSVELTGDTRIKMPGKPQPIDSAKTDCQGSHATDASIAQSSVQYKTMMNHVLFNKSLSPISKALDNFDPSSPWRAPTLPSLQFSRVKSVVQSTPQFFKFPNVGASIKKPTANDNVSQPIDDASTPKKAVTVAKSLRRFDIGNRNAPQPIVDNSTPKTVATVVKSPRKFGNENVDVPQPIVDSSTPKKAALVKSPRKFGTENVNPSQPIVDKLKPMRAITLVKSPRKFGTENFNTSQQFVEKPALKKAVIPGKSPRKFGTEISNVSATSFGTTAVNYNSDESIKNRSSSPLAAAATDLQENTIPLDDCADDKENSAPTNPSSDVDNSHVSPRRLLSNYSPRKVDKISSDTNFLPQAGPSGLQNRKPLNESRILKQSNLNNFLNLDNMPTSTRITTPHGIFDDVDTSPISGKPTIKMTREANVENAFGFDDDDDTDKTDVSLSPIKLPHSKVPADNIHKRIAPKVVKKKQATGNDAVPARLSIGEMKKHLQVPIVEKIKAIGKPKERVEPEESDDQSSRDEQAPTTHKKLVTFADTFDLSTNTSELNDNENLLFADLEPVRFKQVIRLLLSHAQRVCCF